MSLKILGFAILTSVVNTSYGFAAGAVKLDMKISLNDKLISSPRITVLSGDKASVSQQLEDGRLIDLEVVPVLKSDRSVTMAFVVSEVVAGKKTVLASPRVSTRLGEEASIEQSGIDQKSMKLSVTPSI